MLIRVFFHFLTVKTNASINICMQVFVLDIGFLFLLGLYLRLEWMGYIVTI